jgi:hypothetical protein
MMQTFNKRHFEEILKPCLLDRHESVRVDGESHQMLMDEQYFSVSEAGVFPGIKYDAKWLTSESLLLRWRPARELDDPTIEVAETPILPFDFTAKQLAAFMLAGPGSLVADFYGDWGDGPDSASLRHIDPDSKAHTAIVQAYAVYRETEKIVDPYPLELDAEAERTRKAWSVANTEANQREGVFDSKPDTDDSKARRERAKASIAALDLEMEATAAVAKAAQGKWLEAMVRALLKPTQEQTAATPAHVVAESTSDKSGNPKRWTPEKLAELEAYRERHTMAETATKFSISEQRIRKLLPSATPKASFFPTVIHRAR